MDEVEDPATLDLDDFGPVPENISLLDDLHATFLGEEDTVGGDEVERLLSLVDVTADCQI
jgi:hypothetical protein